MPPEDAALEDSSSDLSVLEDSPSPPEDLSPGKSPKKSSKKPWSLYRSMNKQRKIMTVVEPEATRFVSFDSGRTRAVGTQGLRSEIVIVVVTARGALFACVTSRRHAEGYEIDASLRSVTNHMKQFLDYYQENYEYLQAERRIYLLTSSAARAPGLSGPNQIINESYTAEVQLVMDRLKEMRLDFKHVTYEERTGPGRYGRPKPPHGTVFVIGRIVVTGERVDMPGLYLENEPIETWTNDRPEVRSLSSGRRGRYAKTPLVAENDNAEVEDDQEELHEQSELADEAGEESVGRE